MDDRGVESLHYPNHFRILGPPRQPATTLALALSNRLGFPVAPNKTTGHTQTITFLGIEIDTIQQQVRLPLDKLHSLASTVAN